MVSFRGQKKLEPCPDRSPLGVQFKMSNEHPFICGVPPGGLTSNLTGSVKASVVHPTLKLP